MEILDKLFPLEQSNPVWGDRWVDELLDLGRIVVNGCGDLVMGLAGFRRLFRPNWCPATEYRERHCKKPERFRAHGCEYDYCACRFYWCSRCEWIYRTPDGLDEFR